MKNGVFLSPGASEGFEDMFHTIVKCFGCASSALPSSFGDRVFTSSANVGEGECCLSFVVVVEACFTCVDGYSALSVGLVECCVSGIVIK